MGIARRYRLLALSLVVAGVLAGFLGFFFVFVLAPVVPLALFYLAYLFARERRLRTERRAQLRVLEHEAAARRARIEREGDATEARA